MLLADRGSKALEIYHREKPQVAILDLLMPGMNGIAVLEQIRKLDTAMPVIVLTGLTGEGIERRARELGVTDFLEKSFSLHQLGQALNKALTQMGIPEPLTTSKR